MVKGLFLDRNPGNRWLRNLLRIVLVILVYFAAEWIFYRFSSFSPLLIWHPAIGIAFAVGFLGHPAYFIILAICDYVSRIVFGDHPPGFSGMLYSFLFSVIVVVLSKTAKRLTRIDIQTTSSLDTIKLALTALTISTLIGICYYQFLPLNSLVLPDFPFNTILYYTLRDFLGIMFLGFPILAYVGLIRDPEYSELETITGFLRSVRNSIFANKNLLIEFILVGLITAVLISVLLKLPGTENLLIYALFTIPIIFATVRFNRAVASFFFLTIFSVEMVVASQRHFYLEEAIELELLTVSGILVAYVVNAFITERHQFNLDISTHEERLKAIANLTPFSFCQLDRFGVISFANPRFTQLAGYADNDLTGINLSSLIHPDDISKVMSAINTCLRERSIVQTKFRLQSPFENTVWIQGSCSQVQREHTKPRFVLMAITDITSLVTAEAETRTSAQLLTSFINNLPDPAWLKDEFGKYLAINQEMEKLHAIQRENVIGKMDEDVFDPELAKTFIESDRLVREGMKPMRFEAQLRPEEPHLWYETIKSSWIVDGKVKGAVGIARDISARFHTELALKESEARLKSLLNNIPDLVYLKDEKKKFLAANDTFCTNFNLKEEDIIGKTNQDVFDPELAARLDAEEDVVLITKIVRFIESSDVDTEGNQIWYETIKVPVLDNQGQVFGLTSVSRDITHRKKFEVNIQNQLRMESVLTGIAAKLNQIQFENKTLEMQAVLAMIGEYLHVDRCCFTIFSDAPQVPAEIFDWTSDAHPGTKVTLPENPETVFPILWKLFQSETIIGWKKNQSGVDDIGREIKAFLHYSPFAVLCLPVVSVNRNLFGIAWVEVAKGPKDWGEDTAQFLKLSVEMLASTKARVLSEEKLTTAEARYRILAEQIAAVVYIDEVDELATGLYISPKIKDLTGYSANEMLLDPQLYWQMIHPEDRERVKNANVLTNQSGEPFQVEYRMIRKDGKTIWVLDHALLFTNEKGRKLWHGVMHDITERKQIEKALSESQARFHDLFEHTPIALWEEDFSLVKKRLDYLKNSKGVVDIQKYISSHPKEVHTLIDLMKVIDANQAAIQLYEASSKEDLLKYFPVSQQLKPDDLFIQEMVEISKGSTHFSCEGANDIKDGVIRYHNLHFIVVPGYEKTHGRVIVALTDITDRKKNEEQLIFLSTHDGLTGLYSRSYFEAEMARLQVSRSFPVSILIADADYLKETNDKLGHMVGDQLLRKASQILRMTFRPEDVVARIGGDEFAVLLPKTDQETGICLVDRLQLALKEENGRNVVPYRLDLSVGVSTAIQGDSLTDVMRDADRKMYANKLEHHTHR